MMLLLLLLLMFFFILTMLFSLFPCSLLIRGRKAVDIRYLHKIQNPNRHDTDTIVKGGGGGTMGSAEDDDNNDTGLGNIKVHNGDLRSALPFPPIPGLLWDPSWESPLD